MSIDTKLPLNLLWQQICSADGAASSVLYAGRKVDLDGAEQLTLLSSYHQLRLRGYHPTALSKLCPKSLMNEAAQGALQELPEVTEKVPEDGPEFDPYEGLDADQRAYVASSAEHQQRQLDAIVLGLA